jgi:maltooligosyltrehalose trehalohydrolase
VVYNHLGPEGAYLTQFNPEHFADRHQTPWGRAINLDGPGSPMVRAFIIASAVQWVRDYHVDGLRVDATHTLVDDSPTPLVAELADVVRREAGRPVMVHAEDERNLVSLVDTRDRGGWGLDAVWADDFHHVVRRMIAGDTGGYYADFDGTAAELARTLETGWLYSGQPTRRTGRTRGTDPSQIPMRRFVTCLQNHDQIGNRAMGDRLHHRVPAEAWRAASVVLLTSPTTPLIFMGQEWAASTPFQYFTDLDPEFGRLVVDGRRREFAEFPEFADPAGRARIPDPQAPETFAASRLHWPERTTPGHAGVLALYRTLLALRLDHPALGASDETRCHATAPDTDSVVFERPDGDGSFWIAARLRGAGAVDLGPTGATGQPEQWRVVLTTEEASFTERPRPPDIERRAEGPIVRFARAGAVILKKE